MANLAIGTVETRGYAPAPSAADAMDEDANVEIVARTEVGGGFRSVVVRGELGAVKAATEAGAEATSQLGEATVVRVVPRPHADPGRHLGAGSS